MSKKHSAKVSKQSTMHETALHSHNREDDPATRALGIPEILSLVLQSLADVHGDAGRLSIKSSTLVNSLWRHEGNRILWEIVKEDFYEGYRPAISDLECLTRARQQYYAQYIRKLTINYPNVDLDVICELSKLAYPRLENFSMESRWDLDFKHWQPFLVTSLRYLELIEEQPQLIISDDCAMHLSQHCKGLQNLRLGSPRLRKGQQMIAAERITALLKETTSLKDLWWYENSSICVESFSILSQYSGLRHLNLPLIKDSWVEELPANSFTSLTKLVCTVSGHALEMLAPSLSTVQKLHLEEASGSQSMWKIVTHAELGNLRRLTLWLQSGTILDARDITVMASKSPLLQAFNIDGCGTISTMRFLDDDFIERLAKSLPDLTELNLLYRGFSKSISEQSLISLGKHCPRLEIFALDAVVDWNKLFTTAPGMVWPNVKYFSAARGRGSAEGQRQVKRGEITALATAILQRMPSLDPEPNGFPIVYMDQRAQNKFNIIMENMLAARTG